MGNCPPTIYSLYSDAAATTAWPVADTRIKLNYPSDNTQAELEIDTSSGFQTDIYLKGETAAGGPSAVLKITVTVCGTTETLSLSQNYVNLIASYSSTSSNYLLDDNTVSSLYQSDY